MAGLLFPDGAAFGTGSPAEMAQQPSGLAGLLGGAHDALGLLAKRAFGASEMMRQTGVYDPAPLVEAAMLPMGTGAIAGVPVQAGEAVLGAGVRPYGAVPDSLMGFRKSGQPQRAFGETKYPHTQNVEITLPQSSYGPRDTFIDQIQGMNADHALERAWRNWPSALHIRAVNNGK